MPVRMDSPLRLLMSGDNGEAGAGGQRLREAFPKGFEALVWRLLLDLSARMNPHAPNQLFSIALMRFENSSKLCSPLIISPLMKKVGVDCTFSMSAANFWSAAILSSSA
jgi:hypothetical protein